jgi:DNA-binding XRE family transcriptional regulator
MKGTNKEKHLIALIDTHALKIEVHLKQMRGLVQLLKNHTDYRIAAHKAHLTMAKEKAQVMVRIVKLAEIGLEIRAYRKEKGLTIVELAKKIGISHGTLSELETGKTLPSASTLSALRRETGLIL